MGKFDDILYKDDKQFNFLNKAASYIPASTLTAMGFSIASDYGATGRIDLLLGGTALGLLGAGIADITSGKNLMSRAFNKVASFFSKKGPTSQGDLLTYLGIGSCIALGGGEAASYITSHDTLSIQEFFKSASFPKIVANLAPYLMVSALDIPSVHAWANKVASKDNIRTAKTALNIAGGFLVIDFAKKAGLPNYEILAGLQISSILLSTALQLQFLNPRYFCPTMGKTVDEELAFLRNLSETGQLQEYIKEYDHMLFNRGLMSAEDIQRINEQVNKLTKPAP